MKEISEERIGKIKGIWNRMHGRHAPGFRWRNHPFTPYFYDEVNDSFNCMEVSISIDMATEDITLPKLVYLLDDLEKIVFLHYRDQRNIDLGYIGFD